DASQAGDRGTLVRRQHWSGRPVSSLFPRPGFVRASLGNAVALCTALILCAPAYAGSGHASPTALADAAERGDEQAVRALIKGHADVNAPGSGDTSALLWVVRRQ